VFQIVAIWKYEKGPANGGDFVYFGMESVQGNSQVAKCLSAYVLQVLDALEIRNSAGHAEVILTSDGPCLVEIGSRPHGGEGTFMILADKVWGYNQVGAIVDSVIDTNAFDNLPDICGNERQYGYKVDFVSHVTGKLMRLLHLDEIAALPSFICFDLLPKIGDFIPLTSNCFTAVGSVTLSHENRKQVEEDLAIIRLFEPTMFQVEADQQEKDKKQAVRAGP
jgi:hypothetical protein